MKFVSKLPDEGQNIFRDLELKNHNGKELYLTALLSSAGTPIDLCRGQLGTL